MLASRLFISTDREEPAEAEVVSARLMLRARFIRKAASGVYSWLPAGWRVARKIADIVREEMDAAGAAEVFMPAVQPADLWKQSGRWQAYGPELLRFQDRHGRDFCMGPTHEEVVTDIVRGQLAGYKQLPVNLYQIQTKFRDEIRPRFGVMRAREFIMKDAYSFDTDEAGMAASYEAMRVAYCRIFDRIGLRYRMVEADSGAIGGDHSHEFMVLAESGESLILHCPQSGYAASVERCPTPAAPAPAAAPALQPLQKIHTPGVKTIAALAEFLPTPPPPEGNIKTMLVRGDSGSAAVLLRGDHSLNLAKAGMQKAIGGNAHLLPAAEAKAAMGAGFGSLGPINSKLPVVADHALRHAANFVCGANEDDHHYTGANFGRDCPPPLFADLRNAQAGDPSPCGKGALQEARGIEVGHIFQLGEKYSAAMKALVDLPSGARPILMGCYGIGITRIVAAAVEQAHDERGMMFPAAIAPFAAVVTAIGWGKNAEARAAAQKLYEDCRAAGVDVLLDDRDLRPGVMFADTDLMGVPHRLTLGARSVANGEAEYKSRAGGEAENFPLASAAQQLRQKINAEKLA